MKTTCIKRLLLVMLLAMSGFRVCAETAEMSPVHICQKSTPKLDGMPTHPRASIRYSLIAVFLCDNGCLFLENDSECEVTYTVYDSAENLICQDSFVGGSHSVRLDFLQSGQYTINIVCNGVVYEGVFELL